MNNKGFTLVEIIAAIAILSILSGTAVLAVTKYTNKAKKEAYKNYEANLKSAATNYLTTHPEFAFDESLTLSAKTLIEEGLLESMTDPINKDSSCNTNSYVTILGTYDNDNSYNLTYNYKVCLKCASYTSPACK